VNSLPKSVCQDCKVFKRQYAKGLCRGCYQVRKRVILAEAIKRASRACEERVGAIFSDGR